MKQTMIMTLVAATFALPVVAIAGGKDKSAASDTTATTATYATQSEAFKSADTNADGFISREEANGTPHSATFASLDANSDGKLSQEEMSSKDLATSTDQLAAQPGARSEGMTTVAPSASTPSASAPTAVTPTDAGVRK